jgi:multidrug resistance efflux pump
MLKPYTVIAPAAGKLKYRLKLGDYVNPGTMVGHIGDAEVRSAVPGEVRALDRADGDAVNPGDPLVDLGADPNHVWEALRALVLVGQAPDLEAVQRYTRPAPGMPEKVVRQAEETAKAIAARATPPRSP